MSAKHQVDDIRKVTGSQATYVKGHRLRSEGLAFTRDENGGWRNAYEWHGHAVCSCGAASEVLTSNNQRKAWHRQHKLDVIAGGTR